MLRPVVPDGRPARPPPRRRLYPEHGTKPSALYRNLARFAKRFVAGSVASETNGVVDCVAGATVTLSRGAAIVATATTDAFGDFKLDGLEEESGRYTVAVAGPGGRAIRLDIEATKSVSLGVLPI